MKSATQAKSRLNRQDWIEMTFETLTHEGIGAVSIDRLATSLGVTRGSFYYHFRDRADLLNAVLQYWAQNWTYAIREQIAGLGLDPSTALLALMRAVRNNAAADFDAPIRAWALHDATARKVVQEVDEERMRFVQSQFEDLGFRGLDAENRARLFLNYEMSAPAMFAGPDPDAEEDLLLERHRFLTADSTGRE